MISVVLTVVLLLTVFVTPVAARQRGDQEESQGRGRQNAREIQYLDAEVQLINGQPVLWYETEEGYVNIPFDMPSYALSDDGQELPLKRQDDAILLPTEDGLEAVLLKDFSVAMMNGQIVLLAEVNPVLKIPIAIIAGAKIVIIKGLSAAGLVGFTVSTHFAIQFLKRGISVGDLVTVLSTGSRFFDTKYGTRIVFHSGLRIAVAINAKTRNLVTVMDDVNLQQKLRRAQPWISQNWSW